MDLLGRIGKVFSGILLGGVVTACGDVADPSGFAQYVPIEISEAYTGTTVSNIQVLVHLDDTRIPGFDVQSSDTNLLFTSADGYRAYPHEVDTWNTNGISLVWVRLPVLERGARFRMYYGCDNALVKKKTVSDVWEGYNGVWHLNGSFADSVANANVLTNSNTVAIASAPIGSGFGTLNPNSGPVFVTDASKYLDELINEAHLAVSMWMCLNDTPTKWTCLFSPRRQVSGDTLGVVFGSKDNGDNITLLNYDRKYAKTADTTGRFPIGTWHKLDFAFSRTNIVFYLDGAHYYTAVDMDEPKLNWIRWLPWGGCSHGGEYITTDPSSAPAAALSFDECRVGGMLPDADRVAANYIVETTDICEIGEPAEPGDESGVDCSFKAVGETSGTFPFEVSFLASAETRGTDIPPVYEWDFDGDGIYEITTNTPAISHVFASPGRHSVNLRVSAGEYCNTYTIENVVSTTGDIYADGDAAVNGNGTAEHPFNRLEDALNFADCTDHIRIRGEFIYSPEVSRVFDKPGFIFEKWGAGPNPRVRMINGTKAPHLAGTFRINGENSLISGIDFHFNLEAQSAGPFFIVAANNVTFRDCTFKQITWVRDGGGSYATISVLDEGNSLDNLTGLLINGCTFEDINFGYTGSYPVLRPGKNTRVIDSTFTRCASIFTPSRIWWDGVEMNFISNRVFDSVCYVPATTPSNYVNSGSVISYCRNNGWGWPNKLTIAYNVFSNGAHKAASAVSIPIRSFYSGPLVLHHNTFVGYRSAIDISAEENTSQVELHAFDNLLERGVPILTNLHGVAIKNTSFFTDNISRGVAFGSFDPGSSRFARPRCSWASDGWTDGGLYPSYVGAKPPLPPQGLVIFLKSAGNPNSDIPDEPEPDPNGNSPWRIEVLDPTHLAIKYDCHYDELTNYLSNGRVVLNRRFDICDMLANGTFDVSGNGVIKSGSSTVLNGQTFFPAKDGRTALVRDTSLKDRPIDLSPYADTVVHTFVTLNSPMTEGAENTLVTPDGCRIPFIYSDATPTPLFKVNQVGYAASAGEKYVYLGGWMGNGGAIPLNDSYPFELIDAATESVVLNGTFTKRMDDPIWTNGQSFVPLTGEKTLEADISAVTTPGEYYVRVNGVGRSMTFKVTDDALAEQFSAHMHGLFNHRCGCEKQEPYTHHHDHACHLHILRGVHPSNDDEYRTSFKDTNGDVVQESGFSIIKANISDCRERLSLPGGWHDAADYDRRPFHLNIVNELAELYLMRPDNFKDGQLVIPENHNGIPDILDEADWGLRHILGGQQADGGAGVWIETVRHPTYQDGQYPSEDGLVYCLARATRRSTLQYCAMASLLARALYHAGTPAATNRADVYYVSAVKAWNFVQNAEWQKDVKMKGSDGKTVYYNETKWINPLDYVKAIVNLAEISRDTSYFDHLEDKISYSQGGADRGPAGLSNGTAAYLFYNPCVGYETLGRSAYYLNELLLPSDFSSYYIDETKQWRGKVIENANVMLVQMTNSMPYRTPWYEATNNQFVNMSWGALVPLRRATWLCSAHFASGEQKYLDAAYLAADFHAGCNPHGMTWTSGLGKVYPVKFLSLHSLVDGVDEYVDGVTPYHNTFALGAFFALFNRMYTYFPNIWTEANAKPAWRRWENVESMTVNASEYTVWETISPCAAATGYLMSPGHNSPSLQLRPAAKRMSDQPGYWALP